MTNLYLFWFLLSPLFEIDALSFIKLGDHPIITFDRLIIFILFLYYIIKILIKKEKFKLSKIEYTMIFFSLLIIFSIISNSTNKISAARAYVDAFLIPFMIFFLSKNLICNENKIQSIYKIIHIGWFLFINYGNL